MALQKSLEKVDRTVDRPEPPPRIARTSKKLRGKKNPNRVRAAREVWAKRNSKRKKTKSKAIILKGKTEPDLIVTDSIQRAVKERFLLSQTIGQIKESLRLIQDAAMTLNSTSADIPTNLELMGILLEQTIEIWRLVADIKGNVRKTVDVTDGKIIRTLVSRKK